MREHVGHAFGAASESARWKTTPKLALERSPEPAQEIGLAGHGTGKSSAAQMLTEYLEKRHPRMARLVRAAERADLSLLTETEAADFQL